MTISIRGIRQMYRTETTDVFLVTLVIAHPTLSEPIRVVNNSTSIFYNDKEFYAYPFDITLPSDIENQDLLARLVIDNVSREIAQALRIAQSAPSVTVKVLRFRPTETWSDGTFWTDDTGWGAAVLEVLLPTFRLRNVTWDAGIVSGDLTIDELSHLAFPPHNFDPTQFSGLF